MEVKVIVKYEVMSGPSVYWYAFKIMNGLKRAWMTKQKSRDPETHRSTDTRELKSEVLGL